MSFLFASERGQGQGQLHHGREGRLARLGVRRLARHQGIGDSEDTQGLDARVGTDVHKYSGMPLVSGPAGYVVSLVANYIKGITTTMTARTEGLTCGPELNLVCVCNGRFYGGGFNPTNDARPDDGYMDVLIVSGVSRLTIAGALMKYATGKYRAYPQYITFVRTRHLEIDAAEDEVINVDGEAEYGKHVVFDLAPGGVNFLFPRNMPFFN